MCRKREMIMKTFEVPEKVCKAMLERVSKFDSFALFSCEVKMPSTSLRRILSGKRACARNWSNIVYYYHRRILGKSIVESMQEAKVD